MSIKIVNWVKATFEEWKSLGEAEDVIQFNLSFETIIAQFEEQ